MNPTDFPESNFRLLPPPSMPECQPLSCHRYPPRFEPQSLTVVEPGGYISRWEPTPEERSAIAAGGPVWVYVVGDGAPPPIAVAGLSPFVAPVADDPAAIYRPGIEASGGATGSAAHDLAELCVCGHRRGEHQTADLAHRGAYGDGHCGACPCPAFLPAAEGPDPSLEGGGPLPTADEVYGILTRTDATLCACGRPYREHADMTQFPDEPRTVCRGTKAHFVDARGRGPLSSLSVAQLRQRKVGDYSDEKAAKLERQVLQRLHDGMEKARG